MNDIQERFLILSVKRPFCNTGFLKNIDEFWRGVLGTMLFFLQSMLFCCSADFLVTEISAKDQQLILVLNAYGFACPLVVMGKSFV